jgi:Uma2 family endonuclease
MAGLVSSIPPGVIKLTLEDYNVLPNDGKRYEIVDGELYVTPAPSTRHQGISIRLTSRLFRVLDEGGQGRLFNAPIDVVLNEHNIVQPDIVYIKNENRSIIEEKYIKGPPDMVVEILSPSTRRTDVIVKAALYAQFGVPAYWIVDPDLEQIETHSLQHGTYASTGTFRRPERLKLPDYPEIDLDYLFA